MRVQHVLLAGDHFHQVAVLKGALEASLLAAAHVGRRGADPLASLQLSWLNEEEQLDVEPLKEARVPASSE